MALMGVEIVQHDDLTLLERGHKEALHVGLEHLPGGAPLYRQARPHVAGAHARHQRGVLATVPGRLAKGPLAPRCSCPQRGETNVRAALVHEDELSPVEESAYLLLPSTSRFLVSLGGSNTLFCRSSRACGSPGSSWRSRPSPPAAHPTSGGGAPESPPGSLPAAPTGRGAARRCRRRAACARARASAPPSPSAGAALASSL